MRQVEGYIVFGINPKTRKMCYYSRTTDIEVAPLLAEEAGELGWANAYWRADYEPENFPQEKSNASV